jgi:hypothetical protein
MLANQRVAQQEIVVKKYNTTSELAEDRKTSGFCEDLYGAASGASAALGR